MALLRLALWVSLFSSLNAAELAPPSEYEGKPIAAVRFEPPTQPTPRADLDRLLPFKPGTPLHLAEVRAAIKRLFSTGEYSNIEIATEPAANGVILTIRTTEQWFVGPVDVRGGLNRPPNAGQLTNAARLQLGEPYDDPDLQTAVNGMRDLLERNGLFRSTITTQISRDNEHQDVSITFQVNAGNRGRLIDPVVIGNTRVPPDELAKAAGYKGWFRWKAATAANTQSGVRNIRRKYEKEQRLTNSVMLDRTEYLAAQNRVRPIIQADGGPKVKMTATGAKISQGKLYKYVPVQQEESVNRDLLVRGARNLRDYFQDAGYFDAQVDFRTQQINPDLEQITFNIAPGVRHKFVSLQIQGNRYFKSDEIRSRLYLEPAHLLYLRHGRYSEGLARRDEQAVTELYQSNGFRDVKVNVRTIDDYNGKIGDVAAIVNIEEGAQYHVSKLDLTGVTRPDKSTIMAMLASIPGQPFSMTNVGIDRDYILNVYYAAGYPDASFNWRLTPGPGPQEVQLEYEVTEGSPRYVRDVLFFGRHSTSERLIKPIILLKPGDPLSWTTMGRMQRRLYNLGVFDKVDMAIQNPQGDTRNKYVLFHLTEGHRYFTAVGFGAQITRIGGSTTSLDTPTGTAGFAPLVDLQLSRLNLWGLGHTVDLRTRYSTLEQRVSLNYLAPRVRNAEGRDIAVTGLYDNTTDILTFAARRLEGSAQISQRITKATTILGRYVWRDDRVSQLKINPLLIPLVSQPAQVAGFAGNLIQDHRDNPVDAHRGFYNTADAVIFDHAFGGNKNFARFLLRNSYYKSLTRTLVLASNTEFGAIEPFHVPAGTSGFNYVPIAEHFFAGGSSTNRGFPEFQAGPRDPLTGFPLGGNALLFHSTELRFPFIGPNIQGVLFHDMGNVYTGVSSISFRVSQRNLEDFDYMVHAVGVGVRYRTPVGPVRVDLAYSINPPTFHGLKGTYNQLLFGGATPTIQSISHFQFFISIGQAF